MRFFCNTPEEASEEAVPLEDGVDCLGCISDVSVANVGVVVVVVLLVEFE